MPPLLRRLLQPLKPLTLAGLFALAAVALVVQYLDPDHRGAAWLLLAAFAGLFLYVVLSECRGLAMWLATLPMPLLGLALIQLDPRPGVAPVLLVIWVAVSVGLWPTPVVALTALVVNAAFWLVLRAAGFDNPLVVVLINASFQLFAGLCVHYAHSAEQARDALARVNADLLATRALLADSARDAERLRLARELHDVAGHKLTALRLNLRMLAADPRLAGHPGIAAAEDLSADLLGDIRQVVQSLRDERGLDLETALRALAAPLPRPRLQLAIAPQVRVTDPAVAETVLRLVQEALTNAARHADAAELQVRVERRDGQLRIDIEDDGHAAAAIHEGNGIAGMRERLAALRGRLELGRTARGGLRLCARLPA
ncbi:MAG: histidine kinase [Pseudoxanthomonas sp.]